MATAGKSTRAPITVQGFSFKTPDEARAKARQIRDDGEEYAGELRSRGEDARAESVHDKASRTADAIELAASEHETKHSRVAHRPPSKRGAPPPRTPTRAGRSGGGSRRAGGSGGGLFGGAGSALAGRASAAATGTGGDVVEQLVVATITVAFLTVFLSSTRGVSAFGWLVNGTSKFLELLLGPTDPLKGLPTIAPDAAVGSGPAPAVVTGGAKPAKKSTTKGNRVTGAPPAVVTGGAK